MNEEVQRVVGENDLVSTGTACRLFGICSEVLLHLVRKGDYPSVAQWKLK